MGKYIIILLVVICFILGILVWIPRRRRSVLDKQLNDLKRATVDIVNQTLGTDVSTLVNNHIHNIHCDDYIGKIITPDEIYKLHLKDSDLYNNLQKCGYNRMVGLIHALVLWSDKSKLKDMKSFKYFIECLTTLDWNDPELFKDFHGDSSKLAQCIL